jgi:cytoskeletal protein CcmA (bactofilin family)
MLTLRTEFADYTNESTHPSLIATPSSTRLSRGVSIIGSIKFVNEMHIDGEVEGSVDSVGTLTLGQHALILGEIRTKSVKIRGTVEGNVFVTERCELLEGCSLRGDIEAPRLMVDENVTFVGNTKVGAGPNTANKMVSPKHA